jgi:recombinational DNA repair protein RecR
VSNILTDRAQKRRLYAKRKAAGQCVKCGKAGQPLYCPACRDKKRASSAKYLARMREVWKALGICLICGKAQAIDGQTKCGYCAENGEDYNRKWRANTGAPA